MRVYASKENLYNVAIPGKGVLDTRDGKLSTPYAEDHDFEKDEDYAGPIEIKDELINNLIEKAEIADEILREQINVVADASQPVMKSILREHDKFHNKKRWGGKYSLLDITLEKDDPLMNYEDLMHYAQSVLYKNRYVQNREIEKVCSEDIWIKIFAHIGYVLKNGAEKDKSIIVLNKFVRDYKAKNPNLEQIISDVIAYSK